MQTKLENILQKSQSKLFNEIKKQFAKNTFVRNNHYILVKGEAPVLLVAHLDTVHTVSPTHICYDETKNILMSPQGIGGDDRCGVYALMEIYEKAGKKPWLLFTCDEEIGGVGARQFAYDYTGGLLPKKLRDIKMIIEIDRKGYQEAVYYQCNNREFEEYITKKGFHTQVGSYSDIVEIAPAMGVAAVNVSAGYQNEHTNGEYICMPWLQWTINAVSEIVKECVRHDIPQYRFIKRQGAISFWPNAGGILTHREKEYPAKEYLQNEDAWFAWEIYRGLTEEQQEKYNELIEHYDEIELCEYIEEMGDYIIDELYDKL